MRLNFKRVFAAVLIIIGLTLYTFIALMIAGGIKESSCNNEVNTKIVNPWGTMVGTTQEEREKYRVGNQITLGLRESLKCESRIDTRTIISWIFILTPLIITGIFLVKNRNRKR